MTGRTRTDLRLPVVALLLFVFMTSRVYPLSGEQLTVVDTAPPRLVTFDFRPKTANIALDKCDLVATVHATDDLSGVSNIYCAFRSPSGSHHVYFEFQWSLVSGTDRDGVYECPGQIFQYQEPGIWDLQYLTMFDRVGNEVSLSLADMQALGHPTHIVVTDTAWMAHLPVVLTSWESQ